MNEISAVYKSADRCVAAAIDLLRPEISGQPATMEWFPKWVRTDQGHFVQRPDQVSIIPMIVLRRSEQLHSLKEYSDLAKALRQVPEIVVQLDALVGTEFTGSTRVDEDHIIRTLLGRVISRLPNLQLDASAVQQEVDRLYSDLCRTEFEQITVAPLLGLKMQVAPLQLTPKLEIDRLTDTEISKCLYAGMFPSFYVHWGVASLGEVFGIRVHRVFPKRVLRESDDPGMTGKAAQDQNDAAEEVSELTHALKIFKSGKLAIGGMASYTHQWPLDGGMSYGSRGRQHLPAGYELGGDDAEPLRAFWEAFRVAKRKRFLAAAFRRFGFTGDRDNTEDKLVDLVIAAESLVLTNPDDPYRGELRYRLSEGFAFWLEDSCEYSRRQLFEFMRAAYDYRSLVVHGATPSDEEIRLPKEGRVPIHSFVDRLEELFRLALHKAISLPPDAKSLMDWTSVVFGNG